MSIQTSEPDNGPVEFKRHARDYTRVMAMLKWGGIAAFITAMLVMVLLAS